MHFGKLISVGLIVGTASVAANADPMSGAASDASATDAKKASDLIGKEVVDSAGNDVGEVKDFAIDWETGEIDYAVVAVETSLGIDSKLLAVELDKLTASPTEDHLVIQLSKAEIDAAPGFDEDNWPDEAGLQVGAAGTAAQSTASSATDQTSTDTSSSAETGTMGFDSKDSNGDGYITRTEAGSDATNYDRADSNRDGRLDRSEFAAFESMTKSESTYDSSTDSSTSEKDDSTQEEEGTSRY